MINRGSSGRTVTKNIVLLCLFFTGSVAMAAAYEQSVTITEQVGHTWPESILHKTFEVQHPGALFPGHVELHSNGKRVDLQLDAIEPYADGSIRRADAWFRSDLPAGHTHTFALRAGDGSLEQPSDLKLERQGSIFTLSNRHTALRVPAGTWRPADDLSDRVAVADALRSHLGMEGQGDGLPGPILGVRLVSGAWTAAATVQPYEKLDDIWEDLQGLIQPVDATEPAGACLGYSTRITARGPLFVRLRTVYTFENAGRYVSTVTLRSGEPLVRIDEEYTGAGAITIDLGQLQPTNALYKSFRTRKEGKVLPLNYDEPALAALFLGWDGYFQRIAPAFLFTGDPEGDRIGLVSTDADWLPFPYNQALHVETGPGPGLVLKANLDSGHRQWGLYVGDDSDFADSPAEAFYRWWWQNIALPLDTVANWDLAWPAMDDLAFPHTFFDADELPGIRERMATMPEIREFMASRPASTFTDAATALLFSGDTAHLQELRDPSHNYVSDLPAAFLDRAGFWDNSSLNAMQLSDELMKRYVGVELLLGSNTLAAEERRRLLSALALTQHVMNDWHYWPPNWPFSPQKDEPYPGYVQGTPNQKICYITARGIVGCMLRNHPRFDEWMSRVLDEFDRVAADSVAESGAHLESPFYSARDTIRFGPFWTALARAGVETPLWDHWRNRLKGCFTYLGDMLTPPEPRMDGKRVYHPIGRSSCGVVDPTFMIAGEPFGLGDPAYLARMRWCWEEQGRPSPFVMGNTGGRDMSLTLLALSRLADIEPPARAPLRSTRWKGMGAVLRSRAGTDAESNVVFRHDPFAWNLYEGNNGAVYFYGKGAPLLPRFGGYWQKQQGQRDLLDIPFGNRLLFLDGVKAPEWTDALGNMTEFAALGEQADFATGITRDGHWRRSVLFAKDRDRDDPLYLLVRDDVSRPATPTALHWWIMSKQVQPDGLDRPGVVPVKGKDSEWLNRIGQNWTNPPSLKGQRHRFAGQCGVDLEMFIAYPPDPVIVTDAVGFGPPVAYCQNKKLYEYQQLVRIEQPAGQGYLTLFVPVWPDAPPIGLSAVADGAGVAVGRDRLFLADHPLSFKDNEVAFSARAGYVRHGPGNDVRLMVVEGRIESGGFQLAAPEAATLHLKNGVAIIHCIGDAQGIDVVLPPTCRQVRVHSAAHSL